MLKHPKITEDRISKAVEKIRALIVAGTAPISVEAWHVGGEPVPFAEAKNAHYGPFSVGDAWGPQWDTTWFRLRGTVPADWAGKEVVVLFQLNAGGREGFTTEGLIFSPDGTPLRAINAFRNEIEVSRKATGGETFEFYVEGAANTAIDNGALITVGNEKLFRLSQAELGIIDREAAAFHYDYQVAKEAMLVLPETSQRRAELRYALNEALNLLDFESRDTIPLARAALAGVLAKKNGDTAHDLSAIGHAHIDTAWLWPLRETIRKCARTFSTAVDYMDDYPEYVFGCSQAQQYAWIKALYPTIYENIREKIKAGQWEPIGSMWIEVDCNLASGESLIRQILKGKQYFEQEFGYETKDAWIPDVFGYSAALPQIFRGCGIDYFVTQKISWNQLNKFPHHTFYWEGIDGTQIFTHFPPADTYNAEFDAKSLLHNVDNFKEHGLATSSLYVYGFGDGGGGPTIDMLEKSRRYADFDGFPRVKPEKALEFLKKAEAGARDLPVWVGELYLELHRGTYTTQARNKLGNRKSEFLLRDAEFFDSVSKVLAPNRLEQAADPARAVYDVTGLGLPDAHLHVNALDRAWKLVLLNQFHDIIPGSSIGWVYEDSTRDYAAVTELGNSVLRGSLAATDALIDTGSAQSPVRVANTLSFARSEVVTLPDGSLTKIDVPASGYKVVDANETTFEGIEKVSVSTENGGFILSNGLLTLSLDSNGLITRVFDHEVNREVIAPGKTANLFQLHQDVPNSWDAWDVDVFYKETSQDLTAADAVEVVENHPLRAKIRVVRGFGKSRITQEIILNAGSRRVDFVTEVDWQEDHKFLKVAFPVDILSPRATYEIQFGNTERPTHYNTSWDLARFEVCGQKWADLSEGDYGVALLNDCKYGYDIHGNTLRLSLLRAPTAPDPTADRGYHKFTYSLLPHPGDFRSGRVIEEAYQLNVPLQIAALPTQTGTLPGTQSFFEIDRAGVLIEAVKNAEDGNGIILRLYEAYGTRGTFTLKTSLPVKSVIRTDMIERDGDTIPFASGATTLAVKPFEIITLRLLL